MPGKQGRWGNPRGARPQAAGNSGVGCCHDNHSWLLEGHGTRDTVDSCALSAGNPALGKQHFPPRYSPEAFLLFCRPGKQCYAHRPPPGADGRVDTMLTPRRELPPPSSALLP